MKSLNQFFDKIMVITIPRNAQRQKETSALLGRHGVQFEFFSAFVDDALDIERLEAAGLYSRALNQERMKCLMTKGEIGATLTHLAVCRQMMEKAYRKVLILEDDVEVYDRNIPYLGPSLAAVPANWDLLYFGYTKMHLRMPFLLRMKCATLYPLLARLGIKHYDLEQLRRNYRRPYNRYWHRAGCYNGAFAYALSRSGAGKHIATQTPAWTISDVGLQRMVRWGIFDAYNLVHDVFGQRWDLPSSVGPRPLWGNG